MKRHEPGPPLLFTMIMKAIVIPRTTSSDSRRCTGLGASAGLVMAIEFSVQPRVLVAPTLRALGVVRQGPRDRQPKAGKSAEANLTELFAAGAKKPGLFQARAFFASMIQRGPSIFVGVLNSERRG